MPHDHHHHDHHPADLGPAFRWAVALNGTYVIVEAVAGYVTGSLALMADAVHNLTDVAGLLLAWAAAVLAGHPASARFSWGLGRATILAALANGLTILLGSAAVIWEAVTRFSDPAQVPAMTVLWVALIGIGVNIGAAMLFQSARKDDLNARGAYLHMASDAAVSAAVVLAAGGIMLFGWQWLDPVVAIAVSVLIAVTSWSLLKEALHLSLDGVPEGLDLAQIADWLGAQDGVEGVHSLRVWALSTTQNALCAHLVSQTQAPDALRARLRHGLCDAFPLSDVTLQIEQTACAG